MCEGVEYPEGIDSYAFQKSKSILCESTPEVLKSYTWDAVLSELNTHAPTLIQVLRGIVQVKCRVRSSTLQKERRPSEKAVLGVCDAIILKI